jgi:hypothetical protein
MDTTIAALKIALEIITTYLLRNKILDLISRLLQGIISPLDYVIRKLENTYTSIIRLNYRERLLNVVLVSVSLIMLVAEFGTLQEILNQTARGGTIPVGGFQMRVGTIAAIAYITIAVILGFMSLELAHIRRHFQGVFFNDPPRTDDSEGGNSGSPRLRRSMALGFFAALIALAILQGTLAIQRFQLSSNDEVYPRLHAGLALPVFYFILGFLTPLMAAFALLSVDISLALAAKFLVGVIQFVQKVIAVVFMAIEVIVHVVASPIEKLLEFFGIYQERNINERNKDKVKPAIRLGSLDDNSPAYLANLAEMYRLSQSFKRHDGSLMFISDVLAVNFLVPSHEVKIDTSTTFAKIADYIKETYVSLGGRTIRFRYIDSEGTLRDVPMSDKVIDYNRLTDTIVIDGFYAAQAQAGAV